MNDFFAGTVAGTVGIFVGFPLDTIKVHLQADQYPKTRDACKHIYAKYGIRGFYSGIMTPLLCRSFLKGVLFTTYEKTIRLDMLKGKNKHFTMAMGGLVASFPSALGTAFVDLIKITNQRATKFIPHLRKNYKTIKLGYKETLLVGMPYYMIYFPLYDILKENKIPLAGGIAGSIPCLIVFPLDVIKTTTQLPNPKYTVVELWRKEGIRSFYKGVFPALLRAFPTHYATLYVYNLLKARD